MKHNPDLKAFLIGVSSSIDRGGLSSIGGRVKGLLRDIQSVNRTINGFSYIIGINDEGEEALFTAGSQLGRRFSMTQSTLRYAAAIMAGKIEGDFREAMEQARQWKEIEKQIFSLKDGESFAFLTPKGKDTKQGIAFTTVVKMGNKFDLTSALMPSDMDDQQAIQLFKDLTQDRGQIVKFGEGKNQNSALYMGIKGVKVDVRSKDFGEKVKNVLKTKEVNKNLDIKMMPIRESRRIDERFLVKKELSIEDIRINVLPQFKKEDFVKTETTKKKEEMSGAIVEGEVLNEAFPIVQPVFAEFVGENNILNLVLKEESEYFEKEAIESMSTVFFEEKRAVAKSFEVSEEQVIQQVEVKELVKPVVGVLVEEKKGVLKTFEVSEKFVEKPERAQESDVTISEDILEDEVVNFFDGEKKEVATTFNAVENQINEIDEEWEITESAIEENCEELLTEESKDFSEEVVDNMEVPEEETEVNVDGVVNYERDKIMLETSSVDKVATENVPVKIIFDVGSFVIKKPKFFGEVLIHEIILQKPRVFKIPKVIQDELWISETGVKMMLDTSFSSGQMPISLNFLVPAILWWISDLSLSFY